MRRPTIAPRKALALGIGLLMGALLLQPGVAMAEKTIQDVFVTNTPDKPVPVAGSVNVGNLPAEQAVTGTVNVGNAVEHAPAEPFDASVIISAGFGGTPASSQLLLTVPEGKTAVIETASAWFQVEPGLVPRLHIAESIIGVSGSQHFVALHQEGVATAPFRPNGFERWLFNGTETLRMYAPAGSQVRAELFFPLIIQGDPTVENIGRVSITGYFVPEGQ